MVDAAFFAVGTGSPAEVTALTATPRRRCLVSLGAAPAPCKALLI
jgi:hypothetical protein